MTIEEYRKEIKAITLTYERQKSLIDLKYALENNPIKTGDIIKDHIGRGRVLKVSSYRDHRDIPLCRYFIEVLNKDGSKTKRSEKERWSFQRNVNSVNGEPYKYKEN